MIHIALPAYNEEDGLAKLLPAIVEAMQASPEPYRIIVVNDGSSDRTADVAAAHAGVEVISHSTNQGLGPTLRDGLHAALASAADDDVVATLDADDSHDPVLLTAMAKRVRDGCDVVIASRFWPASEVHGVPPFRKLTSWGASILLRLLLPIRGVRDFTCGFRAYRAAALRDAIRGDEDGRFEQITGFECMLDLLLRLRRLEGRSLTFCEVPMILRYDKKRSVSRMRVWRTIGSTLSVIARERLRGDGGRLPRASR